MLDWLANTSYAEWVKVSWGWPFALTFHAFGTAMVVGTMIIICLRLAGLFRSIPYASLNRLVPMIWTGVVIQVLSGFTLWVSKPARYLADGMFEWKFTFVVISIIVFWYFQSTMKREAASWDAAGKVSSRGIRFVAISTLLWAAVLVAGRLTAYLGQLYQHAT